MSQICNQTLVDLFERGARLNTDGVAVVYDDGKQKEMMTYRELVNDVHRVCSL